MFLSHYNVGENSTLNKSVAAVGMGGLRRIAENYPRSSLRDKLKMNGLIQTECADQLRDNFGVVIDDLVLHEATATAAEMNLLGQRITAQAISNLDLSALANPISIPKQLEGPDLRAVEG
jgi:hypothetical protein